MALKRPVRIGKYDVVDLLGKGGMGVVYKAQDPLLGRSVAIKMMTTVEYVDNPDLLQRFYREAQSTGNLHHRNIVTVYELGDQDGSPYLVMEYLEGESLDAIVNGRQVLTLLEKLTLIAEVCDGLTYAHQRAIVHRDIKPANIMVLKDSGVKIVDFGIAHIGDFTVTRTGQLLGSLSYMSPEQISGKQVDARTDIFSLGVVLYQLLTYTLPFEGETPAATLLKIIHDQPQPLADLLESVPDELQEITLRALAKNREDRYPSVQDFAFDLARVRERLQRELLAEHLRQAESAMAREDPLKAKAELLRVLKIDRHNTRAVELLRTAQQRIQRQEVGERVRQLRSEAQEAFQQQQFVLALDLIQKALTLHATNFDLQQIQADVQQAKAKAEELQRVLERAESAYERGELEPAKRAVEQALALAPEDVHAKSLHRTIQREWKQREQRREVEDLLEQAREQLASRQFTRALEVLRRAEEIDSDTPHLQALIGAAQTGQQQERRRKELENVKREIEECLDRDDFQSALARAATALQRFPDEHTLQKLKTLAEKQHAFAERKRFLDDHLQQARELLKQGGAEEALRLLQAAQEKVGDDGRIGPTLDAVRETLDRQRAQVRKAEYLRSANDCVQCKEYAEAIKILNTAQTELGADAEIEDLRQSTIDRMEEVKKAEEEAKKEKQWKKQEEESRHRAEKEKAAEEAQRQHKEEERRGQEHRQKAAVAPPESPAVHQAPGKYVDEILPGTLRTAVPKVVSAPGRSSLATSQSSPARKIAREPSAALIGRLRTPYAVVAAGVVAAAILSLIFWRTTHKPAARALIPVEITTTPAGASVRLKGIGRECVTPKCQLDLKPGTYEIQIDLAGHQSASRRLSVSQGRANSLAVELAPLPVAQETLVSRSADDRLARLVVRGVRSGTEVLVDKQSKGRVSREGTFSTDLPPGDHEVQLMTRKQDAGTVLRQFPGGAVVELNGSDFATAAPAAPVPANLPHADETDWQKARASHSTDDVERFLKQYPNSSFSDQAQRQLEELYWAKAASDDSVPSYNNYLTRFPGGKYSQQAESALSRLDWRAVENTTDSAAVDSFLSRHPSGTYHDKALSKLDDLAWARTGQNDISSLRSYLQSFSNGRHTDEAHKKIEELNHPSRVAHSTPPRIAETPPLDEKRAVLDVLVRYQKAYEHHDLEDLQRIWPGMTEQQIKGVGDFFRHASALNLSFQLLGEPEIDGDHAMVRFTQSLSYVAGGKPGKDSAKVVMQLEKLPGPPETWRINSVR